MKKISTIRPGYYKHFKGNFYKVLYIGTHTETREELVIYTPAFSDNKPIWVKPSYIWNELVKDPNTGILVKRFEYVGELLDTAFDNT